MTERPTPFAPKFFNKSANQNSQFAADSISHFANPNNMEGTTDQQQHQHQPKVEIDVNAMQQDNKTTKSETSINVSPFQPQKSKNLEKKNKQKQFQPPQSNNNQQVAEDPAAASQAVEIEIEYYNVLYTKHLHQKLKVWDDGFLEHWVWNKKLILYASSSRCERLDSKFFRQTPDLGVDEQIRFGKFIVEIQSRRLEGKSSIKREQRSASKPESTSSKKKKEPTELEFKKGFMTGINSKSCKPLSAVPKGNKQPVAFPKKGRKPFVCPQKQPTILNASDMENSESSELTPIQQIIVPGKPTIQQLIELQQTKQDQFNQNRNFIKEQVAQKNSQLIEEGKFHPEDLDEDSVIRLLRKRRAEGKETVSKIPKVKQVPKSGSARSSCGSCMSMSQMPSCRNKSNSKKKKKHKDKKRKKRTRSSDDSDDVQATDMPGFCSQVQEPVVSMSQSQRTTRRQHKRSQSGQCSVAKLDFLIDQEQECELSQKQQIKTTPLKISPKQNNESSSSILESISSTPQVFDLNHLLSTENFPIASPQNNAVKQIQKKPTPEEKDLMARIKRLGGPCSFPQNKPATPNQEVVPLHTPRPSPKKTPIVAHEAFDFDLNKSESHDSEKEDTTKESNVQVVQKQDKPLPNKLGSQIALKKQRSPAEISGEVNSNEPLVYGKSPDSLDQPHLQLKAAVKQNQQLTHKIDKINALDRLKIAQEQKLNQHNRNIKAFDELQIDFMVQHPVHEVPRSKILASRKEYAGFFILSTVEMLKYAVCEDYENAKSEINLIACELEYIKPSKKAKMQNKNYKNLQDLRKRANQAKKNQKKGKPGSTVQQDSSDTDGDAALNGEDPDSDSEIAGAFYLKLRESLPPLVRKDLMHEDLWLLMRRPIVTNQSLAEVPDMILVKNMWFGPSKQQKLRVQIIGDSDQVKFRADSYRYCYKSINLQGYRSLIENLIQFREQTNPYVDSMLAISNTKSKFKKIRKCDPVKIEGIRQATCCSFKLNNDQEFVLNEVTKWFMPKSFRKGKRSSESKTPSSIQGGDEENFDIFGIEEALDTQKNAGVDKIQAHADANILLVHGAFGCGKSYLLVAIIRFISTLLETEGSKDSDAKILICALTNVAVDRILLMLLHSGFTDFARVGSLKKINRELLPYSHHSGNQKKKSDQEALKDLNSMADELKTMANNQQNGITAEQCQELENINIAIRQIKEQTLQSRIESLQEKRVVGATCAATDFEVMKNQQFKIVILDECSQMLETQSLLPISKFNCRKLIAVGDPLQLPPIISFSFKEKKMQTQKLLSASKMAKNMISNVGNVKDLTMSPHIPLFVRLQQQGQPSILLRTQYRCHPNISQLANYLFYENYLLDGVQAEARKRLLKEFAPITFISAEKGMESKSEFSYRNYYEAKFIVALLNYLVNLVMRVQQGLASQSQGQSSVSSDSDSESQSKKHSNKVIDFKNNENDENPPDFSIGVILTYKSQVELMKSLIAESKNDYLKTIQVSTVDAFQGAERDIIVVGTVRTRNLGFIEDCRRLNVAITRARRHLIVVGKESLLRKNQHWRYIIERSLDKTQQVVGYKRVDHFVKLGGLFKMMMKEFQ